MISELAIIDPGAVIGERVSIGPFTTIGPQVEIGDGTDIGSHTVIEGRTRIGTDNEIGHHAVIGAPPQDLKYRGEPTSLEIGDGNKIREFTTLHRGTPDGGGVTRIGNRNMIMAYAHVAHDCQIGSDIVIANAVNMAGHVHIDDFCVIGGVTAIHQFVRIGRYAIIGGFSAVAQDVVPFGMVANDRGRLHGINAIGLKRRGFSSEQRRRISRAVKFLLNPKLNVGSAVEKMKQELPDDQNIQELITFIEASQRGICIR